LFSEDPVPTYQYACTACNHRFEAVQSFSDASLTDCPECTGGLRKVFSSVGIVFKGSGFYRNDSRKGGSTGGKSESGGAAKETSSTSSSGESGSSTGSSTSSAGSSTSSAGSSSGSGAKAAAAS
jgi:putative FmdB family regulatory protein